MTLDLPDDADFETERIDSESGGWRGFRRLLSADPAWNAIAPMRCQSVALLDDEID
jgi:hypothetical protein